ncbi:Glycine-rich RNA-binding protein RZ1B [Hibiscus syriacus]|uniref:Glycine-rich RNA-binding protein RZ1B n=1 Tax=Hibiscus syriacus TaxID=106335 RepID=A0A6A3CNP9_HIBSY|nr:Glycine-rich RNA-binding protein RZ1B [Hibiscus syriacus]
MCCRRPLTTLPDHLQKLLPHVQALHAIAAELGKEDWNFSENPCNNKSSWYTPPLPPNVPQPRVMKNSSVTCNCILNGGQCHIYTIRLTEQDLSGVLPRSLAKLPYLKDIVLFRNFLSGTIPREWATMKLEFVSISQNRLSWPVPSYLGNIATLRVLSLEDNLFSGTIPPELGKLVNMETLILNPIYLTGELPPALANLHSSTYFIDISLLSKPSSADFILAVMKYLLTLVFLQRSKLQRSLPRSQKRERFSKKKEELFVKDGREEENRIFVGGLSWDVTETQLQHAFSQFGKIIESQIMVHRDTGRSHGFGFITFSDRRSMDEAIREIGSYSSSRRDRYAGGDSPVAHDECFNCGRFGHWVRDCPPDGGGRGGSGAMFSSRSRYRGVAIDACGDHFRDRDRYIDDRYDDRRFGDRGRFDRRDDRYGSRDRFIRDRFIRRSRMDFPSGNKETFIGSKKVVNKSRPECIPPSQPRNYGNENLSLVESYWRKSSTVVQRKSGMKVVSRIKHCEVEGVVDDDKLHVLSNCLVGWCKNFTKIGNLASQMQAKRLAGFTLMRAAGNVVLIVFEDSASLRVVKNEKLETLAK